MAEAVLKEGGGFGGLQRVDRRDVLLAAVLSRWELARACLGSASPRVAEACSHLSAARGYLRAATGWLNLGEPLIEELEGDVNRILERLVARCTLDHLALSLGEGSRHVRARAVGVLKRLLSRPSAVAIEATQGTSGVSREYANVAFTSLTTAELASLVRAGAGTPGGHCPAAPRVPGQEPPAGAQGGGALPGSGGRAGKGYGCAGGDLPRPAEGRRGGPRHPWRRGGARPRRGRAAGGPGAPHAPAEAYRSPRREPPRDGVHPRERAAWILLSALRPPPGHGGLHRDLDGEGRLPPLPGHRPRRRGIAGGLLLWRRV